METTVYLFSNNEFTVEHFGVKNEILEVTQLAFAASSPLSFITYKLLKGLVKSNGEKVRDFIKYIKSTSAKFVAKSLVESHEYQFYGNPIVENGSFYISDEFTSGLLISLDDYPDYVYLKKLNALKRICGTLGARSFEITDISSNDIGVDAGGKIPILELAGQAGFNINFDQANGVLRSDERTYGIPSHQPYIPSDLRNWLEIDQEFKSLCDARLESNLLSDSVSIRCDDSISTGIKLSFKSPQLDFGGGVNYKHKTTSIWKVKVNFYPKSDLIDLPTHS